MVAAPRARMLSEKMVGNMIHILDIKNSTPTSEYTPRLPSSTTASSRMSSVPMKCPAVKLNSAANKYSLAAFPLIPATCPANRMKKPLTHTWAPT